MSYLDDSCAKLIDFEGRIPWMYQDSEGYVTVGVGCMLPGAPQACALPFEKKDLPASLEEITTEFARVSSMQKGLRPVAYKGDVTLPDAAIDAELLRRLTVVDRALPAIFRGYAQYPDSWKLALLDMGFNIGVHGLASKFPRFTFAVNSGNGQAAEAECVRPQVGLRRNSWTQQCFSS